ncbi:TOMM precursor leader peptide-binding protein [Nocardia crassostreae]|uniref:TOMM precursor leader peptide-binding protein n=1 Tax=Nocardia crassostreae TaxID=53428 RepID=UPI000833936F|nr:TOMM precursor leader peptide-binding protein [Nocardia crassostreae]
MTTLASTRGPLLDPRITVLLRPDGTVQLGWNSGHARILTAPGPVSAFLRLLDGSRTRPQILWQARKLGFGADMAGDLLDELAATGLLASADPDPLLRTVRVHGRGPLADALGAGLRRIGLRPTRSQAELTVLADTLVPDPVLVAELVRDRRPHLSVRLRDGRGLIGPLVLPGETSCLRCADLHRCDRDPAWPQLSVQLLDRVGHASPAAIATVAALALTEIERIAHGRAALPPATLNATLELNLDSHQLERRPWMPHPRCDCAGR